MNESRQQTLFALDCGATNWRLYRAEYRVTENAPHLQGEPQPAPLTSFVDRQLPATILLDPTGQIPESFGDAAQQALEDDGTRDRVRDYFKPCIGSHLEKHPLPHQKRYTHAQALAYTLMLLGSILEEIRQEKWRGDPFDERIGFTFAYPVHWRLAHGGQIFDEFASQVRNCFPSSMHSCVRFVSEPEGAILSLQRQGLLNSSAGGLTLMVDIGGSTTDMIAAQVEPGSDELDYVGHYGAPFGGGLYDAELAKHIVDAIRLPASVVADDPSMMVTLRVFAQRLKETLSRQWIRPTRAQHVPQRTLTLVTHDGQVYRKVIPLSEETFTSVTRDLDGRFDQLLSDGLDAMGLTGRPVSQVVLVGGGAQLFTIIRALRNRFGDRAVILSDNPEEIVVQGASLEYGARHSQAMPPAGGPTGATSSAASQPGPAGVLKLQGEDGEILPVSMPIWTVGRDPTNALCLQNSLVSRFHAELRQEENQVQLVDLGSRNGTFLNGDRIPPHTPHPLRAGDRVWFATSAFLCLA